LDLLPLLQAAAAATGDRAGMHEHIRTALHRDEAIAPVAVEPLHRALRHRDLRPGPGARHRGGRPPPPPPPPPPPHPPPPPPAPPRAPAPTPPPAAPSPPPPPPPPPGPGRPLSRCPPAGRPARRCAVDSHQDRAPDDHAESGPSGATAAARPGRHVLQPTCLPL